MKTGNGAVSKIIPRNSTLVICATLFVTGMCVLRYLTYTQSIVLLKDGDGYFDFELVQNMTQDDPLLWKYIRTHLKPPSKKPYQLTKADAGLKNSSCVSQCAIAMKYLKNMPNGFFVEAGAYDGETGSNTLALERHFGWTGILIEGSPLTYLKLKSKQRKAWISNVCLSPSAKPFMATFTHAEGTPVAPVSSHVKLIGQVDRFDSPLIMDGPKYFARNNAKTWTNFEVECFPIFAILSTINVTTVDYFSLDVEGLELDILQAIPFERLFVKVFSVEWQLLTQTEQTTLLEFMESKNYIMVEKYYIDFIFVHKSLVDGNKW